MGKNFKQQSILVISLSLGLIVGCSDSPKDPLTSLVGVDGQSYCDTINKIFYKALDAHLTKSRAHATEVYSDALKLLLSRRPLSTRNGQEVLDDILPDGTADLTRLEDCSDLMAIQKAWNDNPTYSAENVDSEGDGISSALASKNRDGQASASETFIFHNFIWAFTRSLDNYSYYIPSFSGSYGVEAYDFGVRLDVSAELAYEVEKVPHARVAAVKDSTQGLHVNDLITAVEWNVSSGMPRRMAVKDISLSELTNFLNKNRSNTITLYVNRKKDDKTLEEISVRLTGEKRMLVDEAAPLVTGELQGNIIYLKLYEFKETAALQIANLISTKRLEWLQQKVKAGEINANPDTGVGIILDLRFNPGGDVAEALRIAGLFLPSQQIGSIRTNSGDSPAFTITSGITFTNPLLVLVNHASASSSEILTQTLAETNRGVVMGERTFGKFIGQSGFELGVGGKMEGIVYITSMRFFGPKGDNLQLKGLTPAITDVSVAQHSTWKQSLKAKCDSKNVSNMNHCIFEMSDWAKFPGGKKGLIEAASSIGPQCKAADNQMALNLTSIRQLALSAKLPSEVLVNNDEVTIEASRILSQFIFSNEQPTVQPAAEKPLTMLKTNLSPQTLQTQDSSEQ